jgi:hypothetical protein
MSTLAHELDRYLAVRRSLGFDLGTDPTMRVVPEIEGTALSTPAKMFGRSQMAQNSPR